MVCSLLTSGFNRQRQRSDSSIYIYIYSCQPRIGAGDTLQHPSPLRHAPPPHSTRQLSMFLRASFDEHVVYLRTPYLDAAAAVQVSQQTGKIFISSSSSAPPLPLEHPLTPLTLPVPWSARTQHRVFDECQQKRFLYKHGRVRISACDATIEEY